MATPKAGDGDRVLGALDDQAAAEYYADPDNRKVSSGTRKRKGTRSRYDSHVPVRFEQSMIAKVQRLAQRDGKTVSSWIRAVVEQEVNRRLPETPVTSSGIPPQLVRFSRHQGQEASETHAEKLESKLDLV
jgi:hypothetical protein